MSIVRAVVYVAGLVLVHAGITLAIGAVLLSAYAGWLLLTGAAP
jgi:hypothetical protein